MNMLFDLRCPDCGGKITEKDKFCPHCGADLDAPMGKPPDSSETELTARQYLEEARQDYDHEYDLPGALQNCDLAIEQQPELAEAHNLRGLILDGLGRPEEAILSYREAIRLDPFFEEARANLKDAENERRTGTQDGAWEDTRPRLKPTKILGGIGAAVLLLIVIAGAYYLLKLGWQYLGPKETLILEPDYPLITFNVTSNDLQNTAQILTERAAQLGYPRILFTVSENGEITAKVPTQVDMEYFFSRISPIGLVEFVDFGKTPLAEGKRVATDLDHKFLQQGQGTRYHTLMKNDEIQDASVGEDVTGKPAVQFVFTENGTNLFYEYTSRNIGSYLGIVRDKVVISCPQVQMPISDGQGNISGAFSTQTAEELAMVLHTRPLPIPIRIKQSAGSE